MTPQERQLVAELFDRLSALESTPRDPDAERTIAEGLQRAPHATYALVQTVLVQDEALKRAHAYIQELEGGPPEQQQESRGFLDNMRDTLFGRDDRRGSVPPVRPGGAGASGVWGQPAGAPPASGWGPGAGPTGGGPMGGGPIGSGGSFLGTAAASAAGVIGGAMLLNGIRSMFGPHTGSAAAFGSDAAAASPWGGSAAGGDLARQAGINDVSRPGRDDDASGGRGGGDDASGGRDAGLFGGDDHDDGDDGYDDGGDDSDFAGDFGGDDSDTA